MEVLRQDIDFFRSKRSIVIQSARLLNYHIQQAGREQTAEQAAAQQTEKEKEALARKEAWRAKAAATRKRKAEEADEGGLGSQHPGWVVISKKDEF